MSINIEDVPKLPGVYKITNNVNGKIYIGKSVNLQRRMTDYRDAERLPLPEGSGRFLQAIKKYGFEGFSLEILELHQERNWFIEQFIMDQEEVWIEYYNATNFKVGYNSYTRASVNGSRLSEETKRKLSKSHMGLLAKEKNPKWGKPNNLGKKLPRTCASVNRKQVQQLNQDTGEVIKIFLSLREVADYFNRTVETVRMCIVKSMKQNRPYKGFKWFYNAGSLPFKKYKLIKQIDIASKKVLATYSSINEAARAIGQKRASLTASMKRGGTCGGFIWEAEI